MYTSKLCTHYVYPIKLLVNTHCRCHGRSRFWTLRWGRGLQPPEDTSLRGKVMGRSIGKAWFAYNQSHRMMMAMAMAMMMMMMMMMVMMAMMMVMVMVMIMMVVMMMMIITTIITIIIVIQFGEYFANNTIVGSARALYGHFSLFNWCGCWPNNWSPSATNNVISI